MDFSIETAALAAASGMGLTAIAFYYLSNLIPETPALKWWAIGFGAITLDYLMVFFLPFDQFGVLIPLWEAVHATFVSGLLIGVLYFLNRKIPFISIGILWIIIVCWGIFSAIVKPAFFYQTFPATLIASGMTFYSGWILFTHRPVYQEPGYRFAGVAFLLWGLNRLNFSFIVFIPWFTPFGYIIAQLTAMAMGIGLIISVLERQRHRAIISESQVKRTTQKAKKELEQRVIERTAELEKSEQRYQIIMEASLQGVYQVDTKGNIIFANPLLAELTGYSTVELDGLSLDVLSPPGKSKALSDDNIAVLASGKPIVGENTLTRKDGRRIEIYFSCSPVLDESGQYNGFMGSVLDISERKKMETQLQQAQKMESIGTLAGGIAHDFNNILFPIMGHTEMLLEDISDDSPLRSGLDEIHTGTIRAKDLVKQILAFSRQENSELKLIKMQPIIKEALKLIRSTIPTTINIKQDIQADPIVIKADPTQIHQIVMNLATNAFHAMEKRGGELKVSLKEVQLGAHDIVATGITPGRYARLTVADTGVGMEKELTGMIFDPFFTTKKKGKGTGMGLSVVHGIVIRMNGAVKVSSEPGKGSEFNVYFPAEKSSFEKQNLQTHDITPGGKEKILLVDDEEAILTMEKQMLERLGYQVILHNNSMKALEAFKDSPDTFDMVITDMAMPNLPGDRLSAELVKIRPDIPVLLCTGFSETMSEEKAASLGIKGFLLKPIVQKDLAGKIREVLDANL